MISFKFKKFKKLKFYIFLLFIFFSYTNIYASSDFSFETEYEKHQNIHNRFFIKTTKNAFLRTSIQEFKKQMNEQKSITPIKLDEISSRTRILLWRELIAISENKNLTIPFILKEKSFSLILNSTIKQPGNARIEGIGNYKKISKILESLEKSDQISIVQNLLNARTSSPYHSFNFELTKINGKNLDLDFLNILLDFEVARRLQKSTNKEIEKAKYLVKEADAVLDMAEEEYYRNSKSYYYGERTDYSGDSEEEKEAFLERYKLTLEFKKFSLEIQKKIDRNIQQKELEASQKDKKIEEADAVLDMAGEEYYRNSKSYYCGERTDYRGNSEEEKEAFLAPYQIKRTKVFEEFKKENKNIRKKYDEIPVASVIIRSLMLKLEDNISFWQFFSAPLLCNNVSYGIYNVFQGNPQHRKDAFKNIFKTLQIKNSPPNKIYQEYLMVFGGEDEDDCSEKLYYSSDQSLSIDDNHLYPV